MVCIPSPQPLLARREQIMRLHSESSLPTSTHLKNVDKL